MKKPVNLKKIILPNLPYAFIALFATKVGQGWRLAPGADFSQKFLHILEGFREAFQSLAPSFHPADLLIGIALAFVMAGLMDRFLLLQRALYPIMIITQTIPTIALAPVLVLWMGFGMAPKITLVVITTFFPIAVGLLANPDAPADSYLNISGTTEAEEVASLYARMLEAATAWQNDFDLEYYIKKELSAYLPVISGTRMMKDYLDYLF